MLHIHVTKTNLTCIGCMPAYGTARVSSHMLIAKLYTSAFSVYLFNTRKQQHQITPVQSIALS